MPQAFLRDPSGAVVDELPLISFDVNLSWLDVPTFTVQFTALDRFVNAATAGGGIILNIPEAGTVISGDFDVPGARSWEAADADGAGQITLSGAGDLAIIADELALPDPSQPVILGGGGSGQTAQFADVRTGPAETVIKGFVSANVGTGRAAWRNEVAGLRLITVATDQARGPTVTASGRYKPLLQLVAPLARKAGFTLSCVMQPDGSILFDVAPTRDLSASAVFARDLGNMRAVTWQTARPTLTHAVMLGSGSGATRTLVERKNLTDAGTWRRVGRRAFDQREATTTAELNQAGDEQLAQAARSGIISATLVDTPRLRYGVDYQVGDTVSIQVASGVGFTDVISAATLHYAADTSLTVTSTVGNADSGQGAPDVRIYRRVLAIEEQLRELSRGT